MNQTLNPKTKFISLAFAALFVLFSAAGIMAQTTVFTYQGRLNDGASPANGTYQMEIALYDAVSGGTQIGSTQTFASVSAANGNFTVQVDFGAAAFSGADRFIEVRVKKPADPGYTVLTPRQQVLSAPYAVRALNAANVETTTAGNSVINAINDPATNITINESRLPANIVRISPAAQQTSATGGDTAATLNVAGASTTYPAYLRMNNDGTFLLNGTTDGLSSSGGVPVEGVGTRMFWHPRKGAFRAGHLNTDYTGADDPLPINSPGTQWDEANIGYYSVAIGENNRASGVNGVAFGKNASASGAQSIALGDYATASGAASVALGYHAHTNARQGSFVFGDRSSIDVFRAGVNHSANWRVSGGFRIFTSSNLSTGVTVQSGASVSNWGQSNAVISTSTGALLTTGGVWQNASSRTLKDNFTSVDSRSILKKVLSLPIQTWNYKAEGAQFRHIGPVSQDFHKIFNVGTSEDSIGTVDADGVALAAIQGLNEELKDRDQKIEKLEERVTRQEQQMTEQQKTIEALKKMLCANNPQAEVCKN